MAQAPQVTRWVDGANELAAQQPRPRFWRTEQGLNCRMLDLKWTGCVFFCGWFLFLSHVSGVSSPQV